MSSGDVRGTLTGMAATKTDEHYTIISADTHAGGHRQKAADRNQHRSFVAGAHGGEWYESGRALHNANQR